MPSRNAGGMNSRPTTFCDTVSKCGPLQGGPILAIVPMKGESNETCNSDCNGGFRDMGGVYGLQVSGSNSNRNAEPEYYCLSVCYGVDHMEMAILIALWYVWVRER